MLRKKSLFIVGVTIFCMLFLAACGSGNNTGSTGNAGGNSNSDNTGNTGSNNNEEVYVLKGLTAWDINSVFSIGFKLFEEKVEEMSNGRIDVQHLGADEVVPAMNQGEAVRNGTADFTFASSAYFSSSFPEVLVTNFSELTPQEERETGALDFLNTYAKERMNSIILGRGDALQFGLYVKKPISSMEEIKGLKLRASTSYLPFFEALGAQVLSIPAAEVYTSLERNVLDGYGWPMVGAVDFALHEQTGAKIYPGYNKDDIVNIMNLDTYNSLPEDLQQVLTDAMIEVEKELVAIHAEAEEKENEILREAGVEIITIEEADEYVKLAFDASWEWVHENIDDAAELEKYFRK